METALTVPESTRLAELESVIAHGLQTFVDVGIALLEIREGRLYRQEFGTFENYCQEKWGMTRQHVNRTIAAAEVARLLEPMGSIPESERQARPLAALLPAEQVTAWQRAVATAPDGRVTAAHVQAVVTELYPPPPPVHIPSPVGLYRCIVLDPPWPIEKIEREVRPNQGAHLDYPTMSLEEIAALPLPSLADPGGCHIYLWVTQRFLPSGLDLFTTWGVKYQCLFTWVKNVGFTPYSWMYDTEHVLFGRIGSLPLEQMGLRLSFSAPVTRHSEKPDTFYSERVILASPEPRLEMFARKAREGFQVWGNEV